MLIWIPPNWFDICSTYVIMRYLCVWCAGVAAPESRVTACVLQAETGLVSLSHFSSSDGVQQVVVAEGVHAVVVPKTQSKILKPKFRHVFKATALLSQLIGPLCCDIRSGWSHANHNLLIESDLLGDRLNKLTGDSCASPTDISAWPGGSQRCLGSSPSEETAGGLWSRCLAQQVRMPTWDGSQGRRA